MSRLSWTLACLVALPLALASEPNPVSTPQLEQLIAQLGHDKFQQRAKAMDGLEKLGPTVLPQLHDAMNKPADPEVRRRLEDVITRLETLGALKPTRVSLKVADQPVRKIVEEISKKSGYKVEIWPPAANSDEREKRLLSLDLNDVTFWDALEEVCERGGLVLQDGWYGNDNMTLRLQMADAFPGYNSNEGPFRIVARSMNYQRNLDLSGTRNQIPDIRRSESLNLNLSISVEPRLPLYGVGQPVITEAIDALGQSLKVGTTNQNMQRSYYSGYRGYMQHVNLTLNPMANGQKIKSLKGTIPVTLIALQRPKITVNKLADVAKQATFKAGTTVLVLEEVTKNGNQVTLKLNLSENNRGGGQDYSWVNTVIQRLEVLDDKGVKLHATSSSWGMNGNSVQGTFTYGGMGNGGTPTKLIYYDWVTLAHDVPFSFQDLPLP